MLDFGTIHSSKLTWEQEHGHAPIVVRLSPLTITRLKRGAVAIRADGSSVRTTTGVGLDWYADSTVADDTAVFEDAYPW